MGADQRKQQPGYQQHVGDVEAAVDQMARERPAEHQERGPGADHRDRQDDRVRDPQTRAGQQVIRERVTGEALDDAQRDQGQSDEPVHLSRLAECSGEKDPAHVHDHRREEHQRGPVMDLPDDQSAAHVERDVKCRGVRARHGDALHRHVPAVIHTCRDRSGSARGNAATESSGSARHDPLVARLNRRRGDVQRGKCALPARISRSGTCVSSRYSRVPPLPSRLRRARNRSTHQPASNIPKNTAETAGPETTETAKRGAVTITPASSNQRIWRRSLRVTLPIRDTTRFISLPDMRPIELISEPGVATVSDGPPSAWQATHPSPDKPPRTAPEAHGIQGCLPPGLVSDVSTDATPKRCVLLPSPVPALSRPPERAMWIASPAGVAEA
jgi:hypothetical protein